MNEIVTAHNSINALTQFYGASLQAMHDKIVALEAQNQSLCTQLAELAKKAAPSPE